MVNAIEQKDTQSEKMRQFIKALKEQYGIITELMMPFGQITIGRKVRSVKFKDGTEIAV